MDCITHHNKFADVDIFEFLALKKTPVNLLGFLHPIE